MALDLYGPGYVSGDSAIAALARTLNQLIENLLASSAGSVPDADATTKGKLALAGDLAGTAALPTVPGLASKLPLAGGTLTGALVLAGDATSALQAVPKQQLDAAVASGVPDATTTVKGKLQLAGDLAGTAALPTVPGLANKADAAATTTALNAKLALAGGTMTGAIVLPGDAATALHAVPKQQLDAGLALKADAAATTTALNAKLALAGGTMTGAIVLAADPTANLQAATKQYVDTGVASATIPDATATVKGKVQLAGDLAGTAAAPTVPGKLALPTATAPAIVSTAGPLIPSPGASSAAIRETLRLPYTSALTSTNKTGQVVNVIGVTLFPDGSMPYPKGWVAIGDDNLDYIHFLSKIDCAGQPVIDSNFFGNSEGLYNPRLSQALDSTVGAYNTLTVGISTMPSGGVGYLAAIDRLVFNSGQTTANSKATFKNLGSVELLSDTMALKFGALGDASLSYLGAGVKVTGAGGLYCNIYQDTGAGGTYFEFAAGKLLVQPRGGDPAMDLAVRARMMPSTTTAAGLRVPHGSAPTSPVDGDVWTTTAGLFVRINGVTKTVTLT